MGLEAVRYRALLTRRSASGSACLMLLALHLRMQRESLTHSGVRILDDLLEEGSAGAASDRRFLDVRNTCCTGKEILAACEAYTQLLREEQTACRRLFSPPSRRNARFQMDALNGQLRQRRPGCQRHAHWASSICKTRSTNNPGGCALVPAGNVACESESAVLGVPYAVRLATLVALGDSLERVLPWHRSYGCR